MVISRGIFSLDIKPFCHSNTQQFLFLYCIWFLIHPGSRLQVIHDASKNAEIFSSKKEEASEASQHRGREFSQDPR